MKQKRLLAALLALLMMLSALSLVACADDADPAKDPSSDVTDDTTPDDEPKPEEDPRIPLDYLPSDTYDGTEIHVLEWSANGQVDVGFDWIPWEEIDVDMSDGDLISGAIYDRNGFVEETYDVKITKEYVSIDGNPPYSAVFQNNETSGDEAYQMITMRSVNIARFCMDGLMTNMNDLSNLHTDMPWWSQDSVRSYTMGSALYFAAPEMLLRDKGATAAMYFNQKIAADANVGDLYELVESGDWTLETMLSMAEDVTADMDGDDIVSSAEDMYGLNAGPRDIPYYIFAGAGKKFATIDEDGYLNLEFGDEETMMIWQDVLDYILYADFYFVNQSDPTLVPEKFNVFTAEKALFQTGMVKSVLSMRNMESDYGVLPIPKYDEYQEQHASLVWMHHDCVLGIPASCSNKEAISVVLEHMSYISYYDIYPLFYDTIILGRSARDAQSKEMLKLIFATRSFDPGQYWLNSSRLGHFLTVREQEVRNISSFWAGLKSSVETAIDDFNKKVEDLS